MIFLYKMMLLNKTTVKKTHANENSYYFGYKFKIQIIGYPNRVWYLTLKPGELKMGLSSR